MKELNMEIEKEKLIIKNRDQSKDGEFIGYQIIHRYRAANSAGEVSFGDVIYVVNPEMTEFYYRFSLENNDSKNLNAIKQVIEHELRGDL